MSNATLADEMKTLLSRFNRGVSSVSVENGDIVVLTKSRKCVSGVMHDFSMCGAFRSVTAGVTDNQTHYYIKATA